LTKFFGVALLTLYFALGISSIANAKNCTKGIPCGNTCISAAFTCHIGTTTGGMSTPVTHALTVHVTGGGSGQVTSDLSGILCSGGSASCISDFAAGDSTILTASAATGSSFQGWSGATCSGTGICAVVLNADTTVTASFTLNPTTAALAVTRLGNGSGTVTSSPSGIACGTTCNASFALQTVVSITASSAADSTFTGWNGGGCSGVGACVVTMAQATTVSATFAARISDITLVSALLPTSRSVQVRTLATFFGTMINASATTTAVNCTVAPTTPIPASFSFQTTDAATNSLRGTVNTPVTIAPGAAQSFLLTITPQSIFAPTDVAFSFTCTNATPAASNLGLNTLSLSASVTQTPDIIALVATATNNGIIDIPGVGGTAAFAVATANVGSSGLITASANYGSANLPIAITICQTNPVSGQCIAPPGPSVTTTMTAGSTPTFSIFVKGNGAVPFQPAVNRIFVQFQDASGAARGSTSVAVRTN
jgi:hypothetical protein